MKKTLKLKITVWFAIIFLMISTFAMVVLYSVSKDILMQNQSTNIRIAVKEFAKKISFTNNQLVVAPGAHFYERGVYRMIFDTSGNLVEGDIPKEFVEGKISFMEDSVREKGDTDNFYLEYDLSLSFGENDYWVKGIAVMTDEMQIVNSVIQRGAVIIFTLALTAIIGAYIIVWRVFAPIEKIQKTAKDISESNDLSRRIQIGRNKDEMHTLANTFDDMLSKIEQNVVREKQFSSDVSHELRTPIAVIISECDYAKSCAKTIQEYMDSINVINKQADRMQKMVTELLMLSRMEAHTIRSEFEDTDISELLTFVCDEQEDIQDDNIHMERHIIPNLMAKVDKGLIARLFINLIANAYQYNKEEGKIDIFLEKCDDKIVFRVKDSGIGIPEHELPLVWKRLYRGDKSRTINGNNNMGLGLSIVKWIAEYHGGCVSVTSKINEGSEFVFELPIC